MSGASQSSSTSDRSWCMLETASDDANTDTAASAAPAHSTLHLVTVPATDETTAVTASTAGAPNADPLPATEETTAGAASTVGTSSAVRRGILYISPQHGVVRFRRGATSYHKKATPKL